MHMQALSVVMGVACTAAALIAYQDTWAATGSQVEVGAGADHPPTLNWGLPSGWEACQDAQGNVYYQNHTTQATQWEKPT